MRPVFPNSATVTVNGRLVLRKAPPGRVALKVRYGLFVHPVHGPVLVDTGYGPQVTEAPGRSLPLRLYSTVLRPMLVEDQAPQAVLARMGFTPADVRLVILTHLHADHVARLDEFPQARILTRRAVLDATLGRSRFANLHRGIFPELLPAGLMDRCTDIDSLPRVAAPPGLPDGHDLFGDGSVLAIDLPGHAEGHFGLCFPRLAPPLLYACDVQWRVQALEPGRAPGYPARAVAEDRAAWAATTAQVAAFARGGGQVVLCHQPEDTPFDLPAAAR